MPTSPPPAPPLPAQALLRYNDSQSKGSSSNPPEYALRVPTCPPDHLQKLSPLKHDATSAAGKFHKTSYFFYGTLKETAILSQVLDIEVVTTALQPAYIIGYSCELWGPYKALVDGPRDAIVEGLAYEVETEADAKKLAHYETSAYEVVPCRIRFGFASDDHESKTIFGSTFAYAGDPQALREKRWDRKLWLKGMEAQFGHKVVSKMFREQMSQAAGS